MSIPRTHPAWALLALAGCLFPCPVSAAGVGFQPEVRVRAATRLDWEFVAGQANRLPLDHDSRRQRYQLFIPPGYKPDRAWPLVVFVSPGDDPLGWKGWQKTCEERSLLFCAAYGAGNGIPLSQRVRVLLDVLDDVRQTHRIDPDRTYLAGLGGGARLACQVAFALPEHFAGVVAVGGAGEVPGLAHLRQRGRERLSVALVTGAQDFARSDSERFFSPLFRDLGVRSRLWVVPDLGHTLPPDAITGQAVAWLEEDVRRRQEDTRTHPDPAGNPDGVIPRRLLASRAVEQAEADLRTPDRLSRAAALLEWVTARCQRTEGAERARALLDEIHADPTRKALLAAQVGREEGAALRARARALEGAGRTTEALAAWHLLARNHPASEEGKNAAVEVKRLEERLANSPFLGAAFENDGLTVREVVSGGPAGRAGWRPGDLLVRVGGDDVLVPADLRRKLADHRPGDRVPFTLRRNGKAVMVTVELGKRTPPE